MFGQSVWLPLLIKIILFLLLSGLFFLLLLPFVIYRILLVRTNSGKWGRECSIKDDPEQKDMYAQGEAWAAQYAAQRTEERIVSDGFHLVGEYYDFGFDKAVIIIPGRMEACRYSCYFAEPYRKIGYNVLTIDNRSHGFSEGKYNNLGYREWVDILVWSRFLHEEKACKSVICHGICIGSATALYALVSPQCPDYLDGLVADGMFPTFRESFKNHLIEDHRPQFPTVLLVMALISPHAHANAFSDGPIRRIKQLQKPILFLYSLEDLYSLPEKGQLLYDLCPAEKQLVWFEKGVHSHLRINAPEKYDQAVAAFVTAHFSKN